MVGNRLLYGTRVAFDLEASPSPKSRAVATVRRGDHSARNDPTLRKASALMAYRLRVVACRLSVSRP